MVLRLKFYVILGLLFAASFTVSAQTILTTSDSALNTGSPVSIAYSAPGTGGSNGVVSLSTNSTENLWLMYNNPWGITSGSGSITETYSGKGSLTTAINLTGLPGSGVDAYPFVLYGCDPWMDCYQNQPPQFPAQLSSMSDLDIDIKYAMTGTITGSDVDLLYDEWVCNSAKPSDSSQCLEVEILPYYSFADFGGGTFVETINEPVMLNGVSSTFSFDEYNGGGNVLFYPHNMPGLASGELSFNILDLLNAAVSINGFSSYQYVAGIELGTEFGASATQSYTLTLSKFEIQQTLSNSNPDPITPTLNWAPASPITYPAPLSSAQFDANVFNGATKINSDGTFTYYVGSVGGVVATTSTILPVGSDTLCVQWTPNSSNSSTYNSVSGCVTIVVKSSTPITPTLSWAPASPITYPAPLSSAQFDANVLNGSTNINADGTFTYYVGPVSNNVVATTNTILPVGSDQLCVQWKPNSSNSSKYNSVSGCATIVVKSQTPITPTLSWAPASPIIYPAHLSASQFDANVLNDSTNINSDGTFTYYVGSVGGVVATTSTILPVGSDKLCVQWKPNSSNSSKYNSVSGCATIVVKSPTPITPTLSWAPASPIIYPAHLSASQFDANVLNGSTNINSDGTFTYYVGSVGGVVATTSTILPVGSDKLCVQWKPNSSNSSKYNSVSGCATIVVKPSTPIT